MSKFKDISGQKFGRLTALYRLHNTKGRTKWLCVCDCGNLKEVLYGSLHSERTKSCGCYGYERLTNSHTTHNQCGTRLYNTWCNMKNRCYNISNKEYKNYGERGIKVCDEWKDDFMAFYNWSMANGYNDTLTIDRIDNNGNYEPNNCRFINYKQQQRNTTRTKHITINGEKHCLKDWCIILGLNYSTITARINKLNWTIERALEL